MIRCASWLESERGLLSVLEVKTYPDMDPEARAQEARGRTAELSEQLSQRYIKAFVDSFAFSHDQTEAVVQHVAARVREAQDRLGLPMAIENISYYLKLGEPEMPETAFISRMSALFSDRAFSIA